MYPTEYAYHNGSVTRSERAGVNCTRYTYIYPTGLGNFLNTSQYIVCHGAQLQLADSDLGPEQYSADACYVWSAGSDHSQLLFIFPTIVTLTTITLHYYSDSVRGLSRLRFYAVPDDFDIWDAVIISYRYVEVAAVPPGGEPAGRRNVSINVNFNTKKVLMQKFSSSFQFAVSEVEFFNCKPTQCSA